jgi:hypothetical protein
MDRYPAGSHGPGGPEGRGGTPDGAPQDVEMFETDATGRLTPIVTGGSAGGRGRTLVSVPGAIAASLLVGALAFGAGGLLPARDVPPEETPAPVAAGQAETAAPSSASEGTAETAGKPGGTEPTDKPKVEPTPLAEKPSAEAPSKAPEATQKPKATPPPATADPYERIDLVVKVADGKVKLDWTGCSPSGFAYWKVMRSTDGKVTWPAGPNDELIAAIAERDTTAYLAKAPAGTEVFYRVFGLVEADGKLVVRCISSLESATVPAPQQTSKPTAPPSGETGSMSLTVTLKDGRPYIDWSGCSSDAFSYYKVVMSKDGTVTWPAGEHDYVIAAIGDQATTAMWHKDAPTGRTLAYRVFCVQATDSGYKVLAATPVKSVTTPAPQPPPAAYTLGFSATPSGGGVLLDWETCSSEGFVYYKVTRSLSSNPSYLPWTDGTEVIGVIESAGNSAFEDAHVTSGQTWYYRVQAIGKWNGEKVVLGQTPVLAVTIP